jgi:hypothetical protein
MLLRRNKREGIHLEQRESVHETELVNREDLKFRAREAAVSHNNSLSVIANVISFLAHLKVGRVDTRIDVRAFQSIGADDQ